MIKKMVGIGVIMISIVAVVYISQITNEKNNLTESNIIQNNVEDVVTTNIQNDNSLFLIERDPEDIFGETEDGVNMYHRYLLVPKEQNIQLYDSLNPKNTNQTVVVVIPVFTLLAYSNQGFYDYYAGKCNEDCLTINADAVYPIPKFDFRSSAMAIQVFQFIGYDRISDLDIHNDPSILLEYDKVILLHNEYVTKKMFDAITSHPKVIYLYPNALYAEISFNEETNSITLIKGHGYPDNSIKNGFDWEHENTDPYEYDKKCDNWEFYDIDNGFMLNCYPEEIIFNDVKLLETIRDL